MAARFDYAKIQGIASGVLSKFAQGTITHTKATPGAGPAYNPGVPTLTVTTLPGAVAAGVSAKFIADGLAIAGDLLVTSSIVSGVSPSAGDALTIDGQKYRIVSVETVPPAGDPIVWKMIARKG